MLLFLIGWPSPSTFAQTLKGGTLRVDVEMETIEVSVKDKQGRPVFDLKKQDFTLAEDGSPTEVTAFDEVRDGEYPQPASVLSQAPVSKIVLIVFDELSLDIQTSRAAREAACRFVRESMQPSDRFGVASYANSLVIAQNLTPDSEKVLKAIQSPANPGSGKQVSVRPDAKAHGTEKTAEGPSLRRDQLERTLEYLASSLKMVKGHKSILLFSLSKDAFQPSNTPNVLDENGYHRVFDDMPTPRRMAVDEVLPDSHDSWPKLGTTVYRLDPSVDAHVDQRLQDINRELRNYYVLGFRPSQERGGKASRLEVKVANRRVKVSHRTLDYGPVWRDDVASSRSEQMLTKALSLKNGAGQLHLSFRPTYFYTSPDQVYLVLSAEIARQGLSFRTQGDSLISVLDVVGIISSAEGKTVLRFSEPFRIQLNNTKEKQTNSPEITYRRNLLLPPGEYKLKLIVADEKGQVGSTERNLTISPGSSSTLAMSALVVTQRTRPMPELIQDLQSQLLEENDPLVYRGHQILVPVEYKLDRQLPMILFFKIHNLRGIDYDRRLVARLRFVNETQQTIELPSIDLRETALPTGPNEVAVGLNFSLQSVMPGNYKLIVEASDAKSQQSAVGETEIIVH